MTGSGNEPLQQTPPAWPSHTEIILEKIRAVSRLAPEPGPCVPLSLWGRQPCSVSGCFMLTVVSRGDRQPFGCEWRSKFGNDRHSLDLMNLHNKRCWGADTHWRCERWEGQGIEHGEHPDLSRCFKSVENKKRTVVPRNIDRGDKKFQTKKIS